MSEPRDLLSLLGTLGKNHSPSAKLRILANSWKTLRNLTPKQQQNLFAAQGLKQASVLLRRAGGRDDRSRDLLLALADRAEKADSVDKLANLFRRVRKGEVSDLIEEGLDHLEEQILGSEEEDEPPPLNLDPLPLDLEPPARAEPPPAPPDEVPADQVARQEIEVEPEDLWSARSVETTRLREPGAILEQLSAERSLLHRFRLVRDRLAELSNSPDLEQAVEEFPLGWARRRFVTQLIREGEVGFEQACQLLQQLPASGEHWGVSAILERYPIDTARLNTLQEVVRSPLSKRRVRRHRV